MRRVAIAACLMTVLSACQPVPELTEVRKDGILAEVTRTLDAFWDTWAQVDFNAGIECWEDSPDLLFASPDGRITTGFATLERLYRPLLGTLTRQDFRFDETHVKVLSMDAACAMQRGTYSQTDTSVATGPTLPFAYTYIWTRTGTGWEITSAHMSAGGPFTQ